jgi:hypothetical protein
MGQLVAFVEYAKIHIISLEQDLESNPESINVIDIPGQISCNQNICCQWQRLY